MSFDLLTTVGTIGGGAIVAYLTSRFALRRDEVAETRAQRKEEYDRFLKLYGEIIALIEALIVGRGRAPDEFAEVARMAAPTLELSSSSVILHAFQNSVQQVNIWSAHTREFEPKQGDGYLIIESANPRREAHKAEADRLYPVMMESYEGLRKAMKEDLESRLRPLGSSSVVRF